MVAIAASGALHPVSPNDTGGVCLSQMVAMVVLGALPPFIDWYRLRMLIVRDHDCALGAVPH